MESRDDGSLIQQELIAPHMNNDFYDDHFPLSLLGCVQVILSILQLLPQSPISQVSNP